MKSSKYVSFFSVALAAVALAGCTDDFDGNLKVKTPFSLQRSDGSAVNISVNQSARVALSTEAGNDGNYKDILNLNGAEFNFLVAKQNVDPSGNHAQASAGNTGQGVGLDAVITQNAPIRQVTNNVNQFCAMTATCWHIVTQQVQGPNGTTQTTYDWNYDFTTGCPGAQVVQIETDYFADQLDVKFTDASGNQVATFQGFGEESYSNKEIGQSVCAINDHYTDSNFRPNYQPNGPYDYR